MRKDEKPSLSIRCRAPEQLVAWVYAGLGAALSAAQNLLCSLHSLSGVAPSPA